MNERIKELMRQSMVEYQFDLRLREWVFFKVDQEKFAEILLKDCVQILERRNEHPVIVNSIKEIKETFGV
jgi:hypothetical protein